MHTIYSCSAVQCTYTVCVPYMKMVLIGMGVCCLPAVAVHDLQDIFALAPRYATRPTKEETINDPTVTKHYWRYR